jgi:hypothetical protein
MAEFGWTGVVRAVIGVIDEVDADDSRPGRVENRRGITSELVVDRVFEFGWVGGTEPVTDRIVFRRVLGLGTDVPDRGSTDGCAEYDLADGSASRGDPSTPSMGISASRSRASDLRSLAVMSVSGSSRSTTE